ncbi:MAG: aminomethyltransferase family protein, partial [Candidatus Binatia bacterium]|nr:aminomethyltransferase family protein [Candidatus Binatia bacterium]
MTRQSPLSEIHRAHGALFEQTYIWSLPAHFGDPLNEYHTIRTHVGLLDLSHRSHLRFSGPDRIPYLQGMVSNDVKGLRPGKGMAAAVLDLQGKVLAETRIYCLEDCLLMDLWEPVKEKILAHLHHHIVADEVEITDLADQYGTVSLQGRRSRDLLIELGGTHVLLSEEFNHHEAVLAGGSCRLIRATHTGEEGYDIMIENNNLLPAVMSIEEKGKNHSLQWIGSQAQEILRIESGIPLYGVDIGEDNLLLETGLDQTVSFDKGCYLGQEVVERVHSRGHVNKKLVGMLLEGGETAHRGAAIDTKQA